MTGWCRLPVTAVGNEKLTPSTAWGGAVELRQQQRRGAEEQDDEEAATRAHLETLIDAPGAAFPSINATTSSGTCSHRTVHNNFNTLEQESNVTF